MKWIDIAELAAYVAGLSAAILVGVLASRAGDISSSIFAGCSLIAVVLMFKD